MIIDLSKVKNEYFINEKYNYDDSYLKNTDIRKLENVSFNGKIYFDFDDNLKIEGICSGIMILPDSITLEDIEYPFSFEIDYIIDENNEEIKEYYEKLKNTLDIMGILWQNIVLEVPIRVTKTDKPNKTKGDGWELYDEFSKKDDPRLECFRTLLDEGKE